MSTTNRESTAFLQLSEDWAATLMAFLNIILILIGVWLPLPKFDWNSVETFGTQLLSGNNLLAISVLALWTLSSAYIAIRLFSKSSFRAFLPSFLAIFIITIVAQLVTANAFFKSLGIEVVLFSLLLGLFISNFTGVAAWLKPAIQTELYIKIGLVILGTSILFKEILQAGALGIIQSLIVVLSVWYFSYWVSKQFKLDDEMRMMLASAVSICGVSAAIATAGAIKGDNKKLSYVISLVLITAIPMMLIMPYLAKIAGMSEAVAGAWLGGTIDTTGAVVAAGTLIGEEALKYATVVKFSQNVLLGLAAFAISVYWTYSHKTTTVEKPTLQSIWERFPKFVLGFLIASLFFSFVLSPETVANVKGTLKGLQTFWFALAFTCIGLETKFKSIFSLDNGRPAAAFLIAQFFNIILTLGVAYLIFSRV